MGNVLCGIFVITTRGLYEAMMEKWNLPHSLNAASTLLTDWLLLMLDKTTTRLVRERNC